MDAFDPKHVAEQSHPDLQSDAKVRRIDFASMEKKEPHNIHTTY